MEKIWHWAEAHPVEAGIAGGMVLIFLMWIMGVFSSSSSSSSSSSGAGNVVGAYYGAEAAQTAAGAQVQIATLQTTAQTASTKIQADAATAIAATQAHATVALGAQGEQVQLGAQDTSYRIAANTNATGMYTNAVNSWYSKFLPVYAQATFPNIFTGHQTVTIPGELAVTN
jgi:hypothetical protein